MAAEDSTNRQRRSADANALEAFARRYTPALRRYFRKRESRPADIDDLIQEVFTRVAKRTGDDEIQQPEAYLLRAASNVWRDFLRKKQTHLASVHEEFDDEQLLHGSESPEHMLQGQQAVEAVIAALNELPERSRQVFVLCRVEGMRQRQVASRLGVSVSSVEKHMIRAVAHLADRLGKTA